MNRIGIVSSLYIPQKGEYVFSKEYIITINKDYKMSYVSRNRYYEININYFIKKGHIIILFNASHYIAILHKEVSKK